MIFNIGILFNKKIKKNLIRIPERLTTGWFVHSGQRIRYLKSIIKDKKE